MKIEYTQNTALRESRNQADLIHVKMEKAFVLIQHWDDLIQKMEDKISKRKKLSPKLDRRLESMKVQRQKHLDDHRSIAFEYDHHFSLYLEILDYMALTPEKIREMIEERELRHSPEYGLAV